MNDGPSERRASGRRAGRAAGPDLLLRVLTWLFYVGLVGLWFKDNVDVLKKYRVSPLAALIPLATVVGVRIVRSLRRQPLTLRWKIDKVFLAVLLLVVLATVVRWPYLLNAERLMSSDDGVSALMGKHIAEGKVPPISFYGQNFLGSLSQHFYAVFFSVFGYSIPVLKFATLLFYLGFIAVQFLLLKEVFSFSFAAVISLLYSLPFGQLLLVSLDNSSAYGLVLLLGATLIYTALRIAVNKNFRRLPLFGFLAGLAFWTHPILASFILVALLILVFRVGLRLRDFGSFSVYAMLGAWPLIFQEVFSGFRIIEFLSGGGAGPSSAAKIQATVRNLQALLAPRHVTLATVLLVLLLAGVAALGILTAISKGRRPYRIFLLFLAMFGLTYWFSRFGDKSAIRYLYPLYFCIPVYLAAPIYLFPNRLRVVLSAGLVAMITILDGWPTHAAFAAFEKKESAVLRQVIEAMKGTGVRYWQADYWEAYVLTAISSEDVIVDTPYWKRYLPYSLEADNQSDGYSYVFLRTPGRAEDFAGLLTSLGVPFKRQNISEASLFYAIGGRVWPSLLEARPPSEIIGVTATGMHERDGYLEVVFRTARAGDHSKFRMNVEIPGYSEVTVAVPNDKGEFTALMPVPPRREYVVRHELDFRGVRIPSTRREIIYRREGEGRSLRTEPVVFLQGVSLPVTRSDQLVRDCRKEVVFEVRPPGAGKPRLRLTIVNPFDFRDMKWYGRYEQRVSLTVGDAAPCEMPLREGKNVLEVDINASASNPEPVLVTMRFRYHFVFDFAPTQLIAARLEKAEIID